MAGRNFALPEARLVSIWKKNGVDAAKRYLEEFETQYLAENPSDRDAAYMYHWLARQYQLIAGDLDRMIESANRGFELATRAVPVSSLDLFGLRTFYEQLLLDAALAAMSLHRLEPAQTLVRNSAWLKLSAGKPISECLLPFLVALGTISASTWDEITSSDQFARINEFCSQVDAFKLASEACKAAEMLMQNGRFVAARGIAELARDINVSYSKPDSARECSQLVAKIDVAQAIGYRGPRQDRILVNGRAYWNRLKDHFVAKTRFLPSWISSSLHLAVNSQERGWELRLESMEAENDRLRIQLSAGASSSTIRSSSWSYQQLMLALFHLDRFITDSPARTLEAYQAFLQRKCASTFAERRGSEVASSSQAYGTLAQEVARIDSRLATLTWTNPILSEINDLVTRRWVISASMSEILIESGGSDWLDRAFAKETIAALGPEELLLDFGIAKPNFGTGTLAYFCFAARGADAEPRLRIIRDAAALEDSMEIASHFWAPMPQDRADREHTQVAYEAAVQALSELLIWPLEEMLGGVRRLFVATDGSLGRLPFAVLRTKAGRLLAEFLEICYISTGRDLSNQTSPDQHNPGPPLIVADVDFGSADIPVQATDGMCSIVPPFLPLSGARTEADLVKRYLPDATVLRGSEATPIRIRSHVSPRLLHIATHGFCIGIIPKSLVDDVYLRPLLQSGLALSGAERFRTTRELQDGELGVITALEVTDLSLTATKLVVLSACDTAQGALAHGDEVMGLRRAFLVAGADAVVATFWSVPDGISQVFMAKFYSVLARGGTAAKALAIAQQCIRDDFPSPRVWAAFGLWGLPKGPVLDAPAAVANAGQ